MYKKILEMLKDLFSDTSVSKKETLDDLQGIRDEVQNMIECIEGELEDD